MWARASLVRASLRVPSRALHSGPALFQRQGRERGSARAHENPLELNKMGYFQFDDVPTFGHMRLQKQRQMLAYYRLLANQLPALKDMHEPFSPPPATHFLTFRFVHYQGEEHPDTSKVVLTFDIKDLFRANVLRTPQAKHKFLLLAGPRWQPPSPAFVQRWNDALERGEEELATLATEDTLGSVKIASSDLPHESQNMKWCSDVLDSMIREANAEPSFTEVPLDVRPYIKSNARGGQTPRPSIADFPKEWL
ncbi:Similar to S.cerevisiae protein RSM24 (Mitochondrial ribosomal protein of the small subunit) [Malassezia sympodialis ATCC 42132]|uniref:Similar to S.cerevisiae protein RSM24 (Mitochondrial ribosomal protein of the small subunit) n=1 Tax=Malassezia sympodialis (strain ATCC 42132) TaxID=1230383 RepID=A0A1M7ZZQ5_MALS4|nr:Similar to S.cerevisiae protein RSM24 (Mitochondrial ribosomal protein of the small subunit) [Malassezia sympodialis ATCC 42132]